jgi:hypothetical protein
LLNKFFFNQRKFLVIFLGAELLVGDSFLNIKKSTQFLCHFCENFLWIFFINYFIKIFGIYFGQNLSTTILLKMKWGKRLGKWSKTNFTKIK